MAENTTYVRNIKKYLLAALYNAPTTISSYYSSLVQHDMYGTDRGPRKVVDFVGKGGATERESFSPSGENERYGVCDDEKGGELIYTAPLTERDSLEGIYTRSVSDIVVLHEDGKDTAHYCDRFGFSQVPEFLQERQRSLTPDALETGETVRTPRGSFYVTAMNREQMEAAGYGFHHQSEDEKYLIMGNGTQAFSIASEQVQEKDNPLRTAEMTLEDDYGMIDGVINNGRRGEEAEKAKPSPGAAGGCETGVFGAQAPGEGPPLP
jgi:hypothetical protein